MKVVDVPEIKAIFDELLVEFGADYVYVRPEGEKPCFNWHEEEGRPGCIIGWVMKKLGAPDDVLATSPNDGSDRLARRVGVAMGIQFTSHALDVMAEVQGYQDVGITWGEAVRLAMGERRRA